MNKICIIVGHGKSKNGGYDSGAVSKNGKWHEFKIAREIAKATHNALVNTYGIEADLMNYNGDLYLSDRIKKANAGDYDFVAEFHLNAGGGTGTECFYSKGSTAGKKYAQAISDGISATFDVTNRGAKTKLNSSGTDYFGIIRQTEAEAVLIETLFIDTASDLVMINTLDGQKKCGEAIAKAIAEVRGAKPIVPLMKPSTASKELYRVRTSWNKPETQKGAYSVLDNAIKECTSGYKVYNSKGVQVYPVTTAYYKAYTGTSSSIDVVFKAIGVPSKYYGKWSKRKPVAKANGITAYIGTAKQNNKLVELARKGKLLKP